MPLLADVRSMFSRKNRRPVEVSVSETDDGTALAESEAGNGKSAATLEAKPFRSRAEANRGYDEVMGMVHRIGDHLERQAERTERLVALMDRLPPALEALPEINRQNALLLDALHEHLSQSKSREETVNTTLSTLTESSGRQTEVLGLIQQQVESNRQATGEISTTLGSLQVALTDLAESNVRSAQVLAELTKTTSEREREVTQVLLRTQKWMIGFVLACGAASVLAIVVAAVALLQQ